MNTTTSLQKKIQAIKELKLGPARVFKKYVAPSLALLKDYCSGTPESQIEPKVLENKMAEFGLTGTVVNISRGPVITRYEIKLDRGVKLSQVRSVSEDLALALMSEHIRIQAPIPSTNLVGIEVPNAKPSTIALKTVLEGMNKTGHLPIAVGVDTTGEAKSVDLTKMPHLLIAGQTGSGKSVCLNGIILSILYTKSPEECQLVLVDPKRVEMTSYKNIPHLRCPVVTEPEDAVKVFESLIKEMENRYRLMASREVRNIESYNSLGTEKLPYIVCVVDEMADLMMCSGKELEKMIVRLAQLSRAVGIHLVLATQKPVVTVITGLIKSNMPSRIAFQVSSQSDSRVILDTNGAESLIGRGDMLMTYPGTPDPVRFHGAWVSDAEIQAVTSSLKGNL
jgi:S-DNA-T family DNA segregation ATPase FtsK/SpoIIIE